MSRFRRKPNQSGFTMIELMVVVVIVGVLAAIAIPLYGKYIKNARVTEATGRIGEIITASKSWAQENPLENGNPQWPDQQSGGTIGYIDLTSDPQANFDYAITQGGGDALTTPLIVAATGKNKMAGVTVTVTVDNINVNGDPPLVQGM